jgi:hypothetical protein
VTFANTWLANDLRQLSFSAAHPANNRLQLMHFYISPHHERIIQFTRHKGTLPHEQNLRITAICLSHFAMCGQKPYD